MLFYRVVASDYTESRGVTPYRLKFDIPRSLMLDMIRRTPNPHLPLYASTPISLFLLVATPCVAQLLERATVIKDARIITMHGEVIERGDVLIKGGRIHAVGADIELPFADRLTAKTVDASGKTIAPGFVDVWSGLGRAGTSASSDATASAWDAFNGYSSDEFNEAWRNGVTSIHLGPGGKSGIKGLSAVIQLARAESGAIGRLLFKDVALCIDLGSEDTSITRAKTFQDVRKKFRAAVDYRKALEEYEADLKEYVKKLEERKKASVKEEAKTKESSGNKVKTGDDKPAESPKPDPRPDPKPDAGKAIDFDYLFRDQEGVTARGRPPESHPSDEIKPKEGEAKDASKKKEDELKKPTKPKYDPTSEILLRAVDHKLPVRIEAHRSADILNALALTEEYNLDIVLEGATDAYLVAETIADAEIPVVLGQTIRTGLHEANEFRRHTAANFARLREAGVPVSIGTGGDTAGSRFVAANAQAAFAHINEVPTSSTPPWLRTITVDAADRLGAGNRVGRIARGMQADVVIWNGDPDDPSSKVDSVFVAGEQVYPQHRQ